MSIVFLSWPALPRNVVPLVSIALNEATALFEHDDPAYILPNLENCWENLVTYVHTYLSPQGHSPTKHRYRDQFDQMKAESDHSPSVFQQVCLLGLSRRLYRLKRQIEAFNAEFEVCLADHSSDLFLT